MNHTRGPWTWHPEDYSMAILAGPDEMRDHVMSVGPCKSCADRAEENGEGWRFGRCTTPKIKDAILIAAAPELLAACKSLLMCIAVNAPDRITAKDDDLVAARAAIYKAEGTP